MIVNKIKKDKAPSVNIEELHRTRENKIKEKVVAFKEVLRLCHLQIKKTARDTNECYCFYIIPPMIFGYPLYDINSCTLYVVEKLVENGFNVVYTHPNLLLISWYQKSKPAPPIEALPPPEPKPIYRPTSEYYPSQNFVGIENNFQSKNYSNNNSTSINSTNYSNQNHQDFLKKKANQLLSDF
jgi:hypothetical protein